jgi:hypothetical protein
MGGRIVERNGKRYGWTSRAFPTAKDATRAVRLAGGTVVQVLG